MPIQQLPLAAWVIGEQLYTPVAHKPCSLLLNAGHLHIASSLLMKVPQDIYSFTVCTLMHLRIVCLTLCQLPQAHTDAQIFLMLLLRCSLNGGNTRLDDSCGRNISEWYYDITHGIQLDLDTVALKLNRNHVDWRWADYKGFIDRLTALLLPSDISRCIDIPIHW